MRKAENGRDCSVALRHAPGRYELATWGWRRQKPHPSRVATHWVEVRLPHDDAPTIPYLPAISPTASSQPPAMPLPPYLKSSASSRAHHALLVALDEAPSAQAEDAAVAVEVERCRGVLAGNRSSVRSRLGCLLCLGMGAGSGRGV